LKILIPIFVYQFSEKDVKEFLLIELQGDLETKSEDALGGKLIGDLHFNLDVKICIDFNLIDD
jgi:hypothetical protein